MRVKKISVKWLREHGACDPGIEWLQEQKQTDPVEILNKLMREQRPSWAKWLLEMMLNNKELRAWWDYENRLSRRFIRQGIKIAKDGK